MELINLSDPDEVLSNGQELAKGVTFKNLFEYSSKIDAFLITLGTLCAMVVGSLQPFIMYLVAILFGSIKADSKKDDFYNSAVSFSTSMAICGIIYLLLAYVAVRCFIILGSRQAFHFRKEFFSAVLKRDLE